MSHVIPNLDTIESQFMGKGRTKKAKILVVDDEPDNLDLLYRTFRRDYQVLKANSGMDALTVLTAEGEVAVIISDQRMPEMKGTEFLSKTVPQFPNTIRIILTGFTDVEDLVDAINSGQVYKYITKPWDPSELKAVVTKATETYDLLRQRTDELDRAQRQASLLKALVDVPHNAATLGECLNQLAIAFGENVFAAQCKLQIVVGGNLSNECGCYNAPATSEQSLDGDPLVKDAIATQSIKLFVRNSAKADYADYYTDETVGAHLAIPLINKNGPFALLSLQWPKDFCLEHHDISTLHLLSNQLALSLACLEVPSES